MKSTILSALPLLGAALALPQSVTPTTTAPSTTITASAGATVGPLGLMSIRSGSDIQYAPINAADSHFYIGKASRTYCPNEPNIPCSSLGNSTYVEVFGTGEMSLTAIVPGGQQVYVGPKGALRFTEPHSSEMPEGSTQGGFSVTDAGAFYEVSHEGGFLACPVHEKKGGAPYQIFVGVEGFERTDCEGFDLAGVEVTDAKPAWEYQ